MTATTRQSIASLPKGHEFATVTFAISPEQVSAYLVAVGDAGSYGDAVPPLAVVALALNALQEQLSLPEGSLHTGQEVTHSAVVHPGETLRLNGRVSARSERQGFVATAIDYEIASDAGTAITARTTIMAPGEASA
jgi:acyl dehydratase